MFSILPSQLNVINDVQPSNAFMPNDLIPFTVTEVNDVHSEKALSAIIVPASSNVIFSTPVFQKAAVPISLTLFKLIFFNVATSPNAEAAIFVTLGDNFTVSKLSYAPARPLLKLNSPI